MTKETLPMADEVVAVTTDAAKTLPSSSSSPPSAQPTLRTLSYQSSQQDHQQQQQLPGDCLPCKIVGSIGFGGLGVYSFYQAQQLPKTLVTRRLGLGLMGAAFLGAAAYRLAMPINQKQPLPYSSEK